jgi:hypothetical protein
MKLFKIFIQKKDPFEIINFVEKLELRSDKTKIGFSFQKDLWCRIRRKWREWLHLHTFSRLPLVTPFQHQKIGSILEMNDFQLPIQRNEFPQG